MSIQLEYAVVDLETTGVMPEWHDRVIEVAVVRTDGNGRILNEYCSLVNPERDVGPTRVHGISAADICNAPSFGDVAGDVLECLAGAVFVAHNVTFDHRFVQAELNRIGCRLPECPRLCTMNLARHLDPDIPSRQLRALCEYFEIPIENSHSAYFDAVAASHLLALCLREMKDLIALDEARQMIRDAWPRRKPSGISFRRTDAAKHAATQKSFLADLAAQLPATSSGDDRTDEYLGLLDRVMEDRRVTQDEFASLLTLAEAIGLSRDQVDAAHRGYMRDLIQVALADRHLSKAETADLEQVRRLLSIDLSDFDDMVKQTQAAAAVRQSRSNVQSTQLAGKSICFTGELQCSIKGEPIERSYAERKAESKGMIIKSGVSKKLDYLVTADPDSMSGKAKKARDYGIRILAEPVFWQLMQIEVD